MSTTTVRSLIRPFLPAIILFIALNGSFALFGKKWESYGFQSEVLIMGNILIFGVTLLTYWLGARGLKSSNNHAFFRSVYGSFMIKFVVLAGAALFYVSQYKKELNKPALFLCMGLYLLYTFFEVSALVKWSKQQKNA